MSPPGDRDGSQGRGIGGVLKDEEGFEGFAPGAADAPRSPASLPS